MSIPSRLAVRLAEAEDGATIAALVNRAFQVETFFLDKDQDRTSLEEPPELVGRVDPHAARVCFAKAEAKLSSPMFMR